MSIRDSGGFAIMRRPDLDASGAKIWEACIHIGNGQHATIRYTKSDLKEGDHTRDTTQRTDGTDNQIHDIPSIHKPNATNTTARTEALASKEGEAK